MENMQVQAMKKWSKRGVDEQTTWLRSWPFLFAHLLPLGAIWTGVGLQDFVLCFALYFIRMFFVTAGYHRYFAHRTYKMGRVMQFTMAFGAMTSIQKGVLWWASYHRHHHRYSDQYEDIHSPKRGFWWSHVGWIICKRYYTPRYELIPDFAKYPELRFLDRHHWIPWAALLAAVGFWGGWSAVWIGFVLSTVLLWHGTFLVNSLAHVMGRRRYATNDTSRNSLLIALLTLGEGWHNNHHHFQASTNQGFFWWELDITYYLLRLLERLGLVSGIRTPPAAVLKRNRIVDGAWDAGMLGQLPGRAVQALASVVDQLSLPITVRPEPAPE